MLKKEDLRAAILDATGHPESGAIAENLDAIVDAIDKKQNPKQEKKDTPAEPETRIVKPSETRTTTPASVIK